ncbi:MAG: haloacid dehalogenase-like hydrolase [Erysipelotrichia bacterium]|jgi:2-hydroxy-3-keto-5-methylthiopentenyl-1-phosphate phosphatase|nr:haloacid dehalogenase-like hydrolase [Erysipelotrichia bacterium]
MAKPIVAIMYDFDKTLSTTDMQNYTFIPNLGLTPAQFWNATSEFTNKSGVERILSYMYMMIVEAKEKGIKLTREYLNSCGKNIKFFPGVTTWFKRINLYGERKGIKVEHYLVSSGTKEIIDGCAIINEFAAAYGCEYHYNSEGEPVWPKYAINYTQKTQFFFRIAKGVFDINDDNAVNEKMTKLRIPYRNIVYLGDGMTDIACMTLVKKNGGRSIAVYPEKEIAQVRKIYEDGRVSFICRSDYSAGSDLEKVIHLIIDSISTYHEIEKKQEALASK